MSVITRSVDEREPGGQEAGSEPWLEPVPVQGCDICAALADQREMARTAGQMDVARLCNREMLNHPRTPATDFR